MVDEFAPPKFFASVRGMKHDQLFTEFNVGDARQMSLSAEVRMRAEYNIKERMRLKSLLLREAKATETIRLRAEASNFGAIEKSLRDETNALRERNVILEKERNALDVKVTELEASATSKGRELTDLNAQLTSVKSQNDNLVDRVHELEVCSSGLQEKITVYEDCMDGSSLGREPSEAALVRLLEKRQCKRIISGINPWSIGSRALTDLRSNKDASIDTLMNTLRLEETLAERLSLTESQPHVLRKLMVPYLFIHRTKYRWCYHSSLPWMFLISGSGRLKRILQIKDYEVVGMDDQADADGNA
ncbi:hypothetical protein Tco_1218052 [Tanacetum coccineum]